MNAVPTASGASPTSLSSRSKRFLRTTSLTISVAAILAGAVTTSAGATTRHQAPLVLKASKHSAVSGTTVAMKTTGGSGSGAVRFSTIGTGCHIGAVSGALSDSGAGLCRVEASKAASKGYAAATASPVYVTFTQACAGEFATNQSPDKASLVTTSWSATGLKGSGPINDTVNGDQWFIDAWYSPTDQWLYAYLTPGTTVTLNWHVTGSCGQVLANQPVTLETQFAPGANNGKGDLDATFSAAGMTGVTGNLSGVTNASGNVSFTFTNTNQYGASAPVGWSLTSAASAEVIESGGGVAWTRMVLQIGSDTFTAPNNLPPGALNPTTNQATDLVDLIVLSNA